MLVLIPILIVAGLFIAARFAPFLWRRPMWGPRMMHHHHRHW